jgi:hypothetical protein
MKGCSKTIILLFVCLLVCVSVASAVRTGPTPEEGLQCCEELGYGGGSLVKTNPNNQTLTNPDGFNVTVTILSAQNISWTLNSNFIVNAVQTKGDGNDVFLYRYNPGQTSDTGLSTPPKENCKPSVNVNHIKFCYSPGIVIVPTPTPTPTQSIPTPTPTPTQGIPTPEFPTVALPVAMIIGITGLVYLIKGRDS